MYTLECTLFHSPYQGGKIARELYTKCDRNHNKCQLIEILLFFALRRRVYALQINLYCLLDMTYNWNRGFYRVTDWTHPLLIYICPEHRLLPWGLHNQAKTCAKVRLTQDTAQTLGSLHRFWDCCCGKEGSIWTVFIWL